MVLTYGHQAVVRWVEESTPGTTPSDPDLKLFSKGTQRVRFGLDKDGQEGLDLGEVDVQELFSVRDAYSITVETHIHNVTTLTDFLSRNADDTLKSYTLEVIPDQDASTPHYIECKGWRPGTVELSGGDNRPYVVTITYIGGIIETPTTSDPYTFTTGGREAKSAISDSIKVWSDGAITVDGSAVAVLLESFSVTFDNGAEAHYDTGSRDPKAAAVSHGTRRITGTATFSLDDGSLGHWSRVDAYAAHTIEVPFGTTTGDDILNLSGVKFPSLEVDIGVDTDLVMGDNDFQATGYSMTTVP